jgi:hypothetical protein
LVDHVVVRVAAVLVFGFGAYTRITRRWPGGRPARGVLPDVVAILRVLALVAMVGVLVDWLWQWAWRWHWGFWIALLIDVSLLALVELTVKSAAVLYRRARSEPDQIDQRAKT